MVKLITLLLSSFVVKPHTFQVRKFITEILLEFKFFSNVPGGCEGVRPNPYLFSLQSDASGRTDPDDCLEARSEVAQDVMCDCLEVCERVFGLKSAG